MTGVVDLEDGFVPVGTEVDGPQDLEGVLSHWAQASNTPTVGKIGARGGSPVITVRIGSDKFVLNRDTKRAAVLEFLAAAARAGGAGNLKWHITTNRDGKLNRVSYRSDDEPTPGWYAYLHPPSSKASAPRDLK